MTRCKKFQFSLVKEVQPPPKRGLLLTRPLGKQTKQGPEKGSGDIEYLQRMVKKLSNKIIDMKRSAGEGNQGQRPYKTFLKINPPFKAIETPPTNLNIDLGNVASDSFYTYHQEKHSERDCPQWVHAMNLMANRFLDEVSLTEQSSSSTRIFLIRKKLIHQKKQPCLYGTLTYQSLSMIYLRFKNHLQRSLL